MINRLNAGDTFPATPLQIAGGGTLSIPGEIPGRYRIALFFRGHW